MHISNLTSLRVNCGSWPNIIPLIVSLVLFSIFMVLVILAQLVPISFTPIAHAPFATLSPVYSILGLCYLFFIELNHFFEPVTGKVVLTTLNLVATVGLATTLIMYLPFQLRRSNSWHAGVRFCHVWICIVLWVDALTNTLDFDTNTDQGDNALDYILIIGLFPVFALGKYVIKLRYHFLETVALTVIDDFENGSLKLCMKPVNADADSDLESNLHDPRHFLPMALKGSESRLLVEQVGRILWFDPKTRNIKAAEKFLEQCSKAYPESNFVKLLCVTFLLHRDNSYESQDKLFKLSDAKTSLVVSYSLFKSGMELKQSIASSKTTRGDALDLVSFVEYQKNLAQAQKHYDMALGSIREFWGKYIIFLTFIDLFLRSKISLAQFNKTSIAIETNTRLADGLYSDLVKKYPNAHAILKNYAMFLEFCMSDPDQAEKYSRKSDELRIIEDERDDMLAADGEGVSSNSDKNGLVTATSDGLIETVNNRLLKMFGYNKSELIGLIIKSNFRSKYQCTRSTPLEGFAQPICEQLQSDGCVQGDGNNSISLRTA
jgi:PAS domain-containing protein